MSQHSISVVIPCYHSAESLPLLIPRLQPVLAEHAARSEIILVNDGSQDGTWETIMQLAQTYPNVRGINLMRNFGQHNALLCGIRAANYELVVTLDDDLQHPPEEIPLLLAKLDEGYDVVYGSPASKQHNIWRRVASWLLRQALRRAMGVDTARNVSAFRVFRTQLRDAFNHFESPYVSIDVLLTWGTTRFTYLFVRHDPRQIGRSNYTFRKLVMHAMDMATGFSTLPLQFASWLGFALTLFGIAVFLYVIGRYLMLGYSVPGFPFLASTIAIFSGAQLFALGIIGEYLSRMYFRTMDRPNYVIRQQIGDKPHD